MKPAWLAKIRCPKCAKARFSVARAARPKDYGAWGVKGLRCLACKESYPVEKPGILRLIPRGDYSRYAYWEKLHATTSPESITAIYKRRFTYAEKGLLNYYAMPRVAKSLGWKVKDSIELGAQWGSNSLVLQRFGIAREIWLLDISVVALRGALAFYAQFGKPPFCVQGEIHGLPFKDGAFGLSLSGGLYEHFVGEEQERLVAENVRISQKVLCQVPESSLAYWLYRGLVTVIKFGWPFGFERPLFYRRLKRLYEEGGATVLRRDWHNLASALLMVLGEKYPWLQRFTVRPGIFFLLRHDAVIAAQKNK